MRINEVLLMYSCYLLFSNRLHTNNVKSAKLKLGLLIELFIMKKHVQEETFLNGY